MSAVGWRRLLHATHAVAAVLLLASGLLMQSPELRARFVGGYGREIAQVHEAAAVPFVLIPLLALLRVGRALVRDARRRLGPPDPLSWVKVHIVLSVVTTVLLSLTGVVLWFDELFPFALADLSLDIHAWLTWLFLVMLVVHLFAARRKMGSLLRDLWTGRTHQGVEPGDPLELSD